MKTFNFFVFASVFFIIDMCWQHSAESCAFICVFYEKKWRKNFYHHKTSSRILFVFTGGDFCVFPLGSCVSDSTRLGSNSAINNKWFVSVCTQQHTANTLRMSWRSLRVLRNDKHITAPQTSSTAELEGKLFCWHFHLFFSLLRWHNTKHSDENKNREYRDEGNILCVSVDRFKKKKKNHGNMLRVGKCAIRKK